MKLPKGSIMIWRKGTLIGVDANGVVSMAEEPFTLSTWEEIKTPGASTNFVIPSEHSRAALSVTIERIEKSTRMANGRTRKFITADKRTFSTSWELLPYVASATVDGNAGIKDMEEFYNNVPGYFILTIVPGDAFRDVNGARTVDPDLTKLQHYQAVFTEFTPSIEKRTANDKGNLSVTIEEV